MSKIKGHENAQEVKLIFIDTKEEIEFKSIAYAKRVTGLTEYGIRAGLNPLQKKRFEVNGRQVCFRVIK